MGSSHWMGADAMGGDINKPETDAPLISTSRTLMSVLQNKITWGEITFPPGAGEVTLGHVHSCAVPALLLPIPDSIWGDTVISVSLHAAVCRSVSGSQQDSLWSTLHRIMRVVCLSIIQSWSQTAVCADVDTFST